MTGWVRRLLPDLAHAALALDLGSSADRAPTDP
jgi:hypothetical protein